MVEEWGKIITEVGLAFIKIAQQRYQQFYKVPGIGLSKFFIDYHSHSEQLVDALANWARKIKLNFTSCRYENGLFDKDCRQPESMNKGFMLYMKKHLEKETKYGILVSVSEIESSHRKLCEKIGEIMISDAPISIKPSFQKIIFDRIESARRTLKSKDTSLTENNIYLPVFVFKEIFDTVCAGESTIPLSIRVKDNYRSQLWYGNERQALGQGDDAIIRKLNEVIKELVQDNEIKKRVAEYSETHNQLMNDQKINELKNKIEVSNRCTIFFWTSFQTSGFRIPF